VPKITRRPSLRSVEERNQLIIQYQYAPAYVAKRAVLINPICQGLGVDECIGIATLYLIRAAELWDPNRIPAVTFKTYAIAAMFKGLFRDVKTQTVIRTPPKTYNEKYKEDRERAYSIRRLVAYAKRNPNNLRHGQDPEDHLVGEFGPCSGFNKDDIDHLHYLISKLRHRDQLILYHYLYGRNYSEVASLMRMSKQWVGDRFRYIVERLREHENSVA